MILKKFKEEINYYKKNKKELLYIILPIILACILLVPVPYVYTIGGGIIKIDKKIKIEDEHKSKGSLNAAYVKEINGTVFTYLTSKIMGYKEEKKEDIVLTNETIDEYNFRERLMFESSINNAILIAYNKAEENININKIRYYVIYKDAFSETNLKVKDEILKIDGKDITEYNDMREALDNHNPGDKIKIIVVRDGKNIETESTIKEIDNNKGIGIYMNEQYDYDLDKDIEFLFSNNEAGPSGGLMLSLSIYNKLTKSDITKGKNITGTGTIERDGTVGKISGIKYKLKGAVNNKSDIFLVPKDNYEEAIKYKKKNNYRIKIISVESFDDAIYKLKNL